MRGYVLFALFFARSISPPCSLFGQQTCVLLALLSRLGRFGAVVCTLSQLYSSQCSEEGTDTRCDSRWITTGLRLVTVVIFQSYHIMSGERGVGVIMMGVLSRVLFLVFSGLCQDHTDTAFCKALSPCFQGSAHNNPGIRGAAKMGWDGLGRGRLRGRGMELRLEDTDLTS